MLLQSYRHPAVYQSGIDQIITAMEREYFDLTVLVGNWESVNLNPTVMIHRNGDSYQLSIIYMNETTRQASPSTYEIQEDKQGYFISLNGKHTSVSYDVRLDTLTIATFGDYIRN